VKLPYDPEAEGAVLAACLQDTDALAEVVETLSADDFHKPAHRIIFEAACELFGRGDSVDPVTVAAALTSAGNLDRIGGKNALAEIIAGHPFVFNAHRHARIVRDRATLRRLMSAGAAIQDVAKAVPDDVPAAVDECESLVFAVRDDRSGRTPKLVRDSLGAVMESLERRQQVGGEITGVPTGFSDFDTMTTGLLPEQLVMVGARPGMGKTVWLTSVALNAARLGHTTAMFSLEMSRLEMVTRMYSAVSRVPMQRIRTGTLREQDWAGLSNATAKLADVPLYLDAPSSLSLMDLRARARRLKAKSGLGLLVVDYLQLMAVPKGENRNQEIAELSRGLKMLARDLDCPVLVASQLNRGLEMRADKRPNLSDLRDSGAVEQDSDIVAFLYRDAVYREDADPKKAELIVAKHRNGPTGTIPLSFLADTVTFASLIDYGRPA